MGYPVFVCMSCNRALGGERNEYGHAPDCPSHPDARIRRIVREELAKLLAERRRS